MLPALIYWYDFPHTKNLIIFYYLNTLSQHLTQPFNRDLNDIPMYFIKTFYFHKRENGIGQEKSYVCPFPVSRCISDISNRQQL